MLSHSKQREKDGTKALGGNAIAEFEESIKVQMEEVSGRGCQEMRSEKWEGV